MNDSACCAHTRILYCRGHNHDGSQFDRWQCADCDQRFSPDSLFNLKLAAISSASLANTRETRADRIGRENPCWTQAYAAVCTAIDREINQRERAESNRAKLADLKNKLGALYFDI
jgi:hypothetical protein